MSSAMSQDGVVIRDATAADAAAVAAIYAGHVLRGTASFDTAPPPVEAIAAKMAWVRDSGWAWLVAEAGANVGAGAGAGAEGIVGYAYYTQFRDRPAYGWCAEDSIYLRPDWTGRGVGTRLLSAVLARAEAAGFRQMAAVVGDAAPASLALHARLGFREVGRMRSVGWKFGRWLDAVYLQRALGDGDASGV